MEARSKGKIPHSKRKERIRPPNPYQPKYLYVQKYKRFGLLNELGLLWSNRISSRILRIIALIKPEWKKDLELDRPDKAYRNLWKLLKVFDLMSPISYDLYRPLPMDRWLNRALIYDGYVVNLFYAVTLRVLSHVVTDIHHSYQIYWYPSTISEGEPSRKNQRNAKRGSVVSSWT